MDIARSYSETEAKSPQLSFHGSMQGTVMIYTVLSQELGNNFLACVQS